MKAIQTLITLTTFFIIYSFINELHVSASQQTVHIQGKVNFLFFLFLIKIIYPKIFCLLKNS